jgi:hypothetical protein
MSPNEHAHDLIDRLPPAQLAAVVHLLETIISADDDGTLSESDVKAIAEADEWLKHNKPIEHEEILADLGLTMVDWEKMVDEPERAPRRDG